MMKKNFLKLAAISLGVAILVSSCLKTEELDSVKAMREAKVSDMKASTALKNADVQSRLVSIAATRIQNSFDSLNNAYRLQLAAINNRYNEADTKIRENQANVDAATTANSIAKLAESLKLELADLKLKQDQKNAEIANQALASQVSLSQAKVSLINQQIAELTANYNLVKKKDEDPTQGRLLADYNYYYNGGGTVSAGYTIAAGDGIYGLKVKNMNLQSDILDKITAQAKAKVDSADLRLTKEKSIQDEKEDNAKQTMLIGIYTDAKNTQNYQAAYTSLVALATAAFNDVKAKEAAQKAVQVKVDTATKVSDVATAAYNANETKKSDATTAMNTILNKAAYQIGGTSPKTVDGLNLKLVEYTKTLANNDISIAAAQKSLLDVTNDYTTHKQKYELLLSKLNTAAGKKDDALAALNRINYIIDTADMALPNHETKWDDSLTNRTTMYGNAFTAYNTVKAEYDQAYADYGTSQASLLNAQNAVSTAQDAKKTTQTNVDNLTADITKFNAEKVKYDAAVAAAVSLLATKTAKADQLAALTAENTAATTAVTNAVAYSTTTISLRDGMETLINNQLTDSQTIDKGLALLNKNIADNNVDIIQLQNEIADLGNKDYKNADAISEYKTKIAANQELITLYEKEAAALKALIDKF